MAVSLVRKTRSGRGDKPESDERQVRFDDAVKQIVGRLTKLAEEQASKRNPKEMEWLEAVRQFEGRYTAPELKDFVDRKRSELFANQTRPKTLAWESRLGDLLFPTDDKNWGISATAVPEISQEAARAVREAEEATARANSEQERGNPGGAAQIVEGAQGAAQQAVKLQAELEEVRKRAARMEKVMTDQLDACQYGPEARDCIRDACKLGTGVLKGPVTAYRGRRVWRASEGGQYSMDGEIPPRPEFRRVDIWNYFPDSNARKKSECEFEFERYLWREHDLRALARQPGYDVAAIRRLLVDGPKDDQPAFVGQLRAISGESVGTEQVYVGWEYHGTLKTDEIKILMEAGGGEIEDLEVDPVDERRVIVWFCGTEVLKAVQHPLESGESLYSVFPFEVDDSSVFGRGVPFLMKDSQNALNAAWRMIMDNGAFSVGPQVVVDKIQLEPADNNWDLRPLKLWAWARKAAGLASSAAPFQVFNIPCNQVELVNIINLALRFIDDEAMMPVYAQGEPGTRASTPAGAGTASGLTLIMNSANVGFRRVVKNWDDGMTVPSLQRLFDWNMQFNPDETIKGDMEINARGSSVLLIREAQTANLAAVATQWSVHPVLSNLIKVPTAARKAVQGMSIDPDEIVKSDEEIELDEMKRANEEQMPPPEVIRAKAQTDAAEIAAQSRIEVAKIGRQALLERIAEEHNMKVTELEALVNRAKAQAAAKERIFAAETAVEAENQARERAEGEKPSGSGGYLS